MKFKDKIVVVTGASKGIGAACSRLFLEQGAQVVMLDIWEDENPIKGSHFIKCDVSDERSVSGAFNHIEEKFGKLDFLVNNAGIQKYGTVTSTTLEDWDLVFNVNLRSMFLCAQKAIPLMQKAGKGVVINVASVQSFVSQKNVVAYTTAKTAVLGLTRSIAVDFAPEIRCIAVCPGTIDTPMLRDSIALSENPDEVLQECYDMHPIGRIGNPEEISELIGFLCEDKCTFITGEAIRIDGGLGITIGGSKR
ncbi:SDR family oxidoreductase [Pararhodonellum marinum]|uniref:SDR family oxidoreductase n=1 Tax=Pararhodonellum marinum TaxID=2755358 RepID=UPI00189092B3|nr:SDR family oxidoreductase [Pararhodonellum marinum]